MAAEGLLLDQADLLELGDREAIDENHSRAVELAESSRDAYHAWGIALTDTAFALMEGRFAEAEELSKRALALGQRGGQNTNAVLGYGVHLTLLARDRQIARSSEYIPALKGVIAKFPLFPALQCALALAYLGLGREEEARREFERMAEHDFSEFHRDMTWILAMVLLAESCVELKDVRRASVLYDLLLPYADRCVPIGPFCGYCGAVAHRLGRLAALVRRWDDAMAHFDAGLERETRMRAWPFLAKTHHHYARMFLARDEDGDRARALEHLGQALHVAQRLQMRDLVDAVIADKLRAQGLGSIDGRTSIDAVELSVQRERPNLGRHKGPDGSVTIVFIDVESVKGLMERLGDQETQAILGAHSAAVRRHVGGSWRV